MSTISPRGGFLTSNLGIGTDTLLLPCPWLHSFMWLAREWCNLKIKFCNKILNCVLQFQHLPEGFISTNMTDQLCSLPSIPLGISPMLAGQDFRSAGVSAIIAPRYTNTTLSHSGIILSPARWVGRESRNPIYNCEWWLLQPGLSF